MRLLIAKLATASVQSVSVALNSETDLADLATDLDSCVRLLRGGSYDLVLLIVSQGRLRARDAIARLRREAGHVPMVVLTEPASGETASVAGGMTSGGRIAAPLPEAIEPADAENAPWSWDEPPPVLAETARPRLHYRRVPRRVVLDPQNESLRVDDQPLGLSQAEFRIFNQLWENRGRIVSAEDLMSAIYGDSERPASRVLPVFLFKLRRKLAALGLGDLVETAIGRGFTIRADAEAEAEHA
jgi:two-component system cell cycle response regulator CtrA